MEEFLLKSRRRKDTEYLYYYLTLGVSASVMRYEKLEALRVGNEEVKPSLLLFDSKLEINKVQNSM